MSRVWESMREGELFGDASVNLISSIESLLRGSNLDHDERAGIERQLKDLSEEEGLRLVQYLSQNQIDPIYAGLNYNQTDISNKLKKEL